MLLGNNDYEAGIIKVLLGSSGASMTLRQWAILNFQTFTCPVSSAAAYRTWNNIPVWRYRYFDKFPNLRLTFNPSSGAWYGSEIATVFGTAKLAGLPNTPTEAAISKYIMSAWAAFAKNPAVAFLRAPYSWLLYNPQGKQLLQPRELMRGCDGLTHSIANTLVRLAYDNQTFPFFILSVTYDYACLLILAPGGPDMESLKGVANLAQLGGGSKLGY